jgi:hypothetical protein
VASSLSACSGSYMCDVSAAMGVKILEEWRFGGTEAG